MAHLSSILLVDDDPTDNFLNEMLLSSLNVADHVLVAESGSEALQLLVDNYPPPSAPRCPSLVLLDINMPGMNGVEFLEAFQHLPMAAHHQPVIIMLGTALHSTDLARIGGLPVSGLVRKPLTLEKVEAILQLHFN
jgi:CheY-like chemotaxis protein